MNAQTLVNRVLRRVPGYAVSEYLDEINSVYQEVWDKIVQLDDSYFTEVKQVVVNTSATEFDFLWNQNGNLVSSVSNRYFQISRIRVLPPGGSAWVTTTPRDWNHPQLLEQSANANPPINQSAAFIYTPVSKGSVIFGLPVAAGSTFEVTYTFIFMPLVILSNGTVSSSTNAVTGTSTNFTQILGPDYQSSLPGVDLDAEVGVELMFAATAAGQQPIYRVKTIISDLALTTFTPIVPAASTSAYTLASSPDIPDGYHNLLATMATRNIMSTPADDIRYPQWKDAADEQTQSMKDSVMTRQRQLPPQRRRFPYSVYGVVNR